MPMKIFDDLDIGARDTLKTRLLALVANLPLTEAQSAEFQSALAVLGLDQAVGPERVPLPAFKQLLQGRLMELPFAALLATTLKSTDLLAADFDRLAGWVLVASIVLYARDPDHASKIADALASVRLMARERERFVLSWFEGSALVADVITMANDNRGPTPSLGRTVDRGADIHVLLVSYLEGKSPTTHRASDEEDDIYYVTEIAPVAAFDLDDEVDGIDLVHTVQLLRSNGDPVNPEHETHRVTALVSTKGHSQARRIGAHQRHRDTIAVQSILRRRMALPCAYGALTSHEIGTVLQAFQGETGKDWRERLLILLCLLTGRLPDILLALPRNQGEKRKADTTWWERDAEGVAICYDLGLTSRRFSKDARALLGPAPKPLRLAMPIELATPIKHLFGQLKRDDQAKLSVDRMFQSLWPKHHRPVTLRRVSSVMRDRIVQSGYDSSVAAYVAGDSPQNIPALYYVAHDNAHIETIFRRTVNALPGASYTWPETASHTVGSSLQPMGVMIRAFYAEADAALRTTSLLLPRDKLRFHNQYTALVCTSLALMTGHRPVRRPFELLSDFDLKNGIVFISDKELRSANAGRFVPMTKSTVEQIEAWLNHLGTIAPIIGHGGDEVIVAVRSALNGTGPLFFWLDLIGDDKQIRFEPVAPKRLEQELDQIWPLPLNWGRHVQRTELTKIHCDLVDAYMGHSDPGAEALGSQSALGLHDLEALRAHLEHWSRTHRVRVFRGFQ